MLHHYDHIFKALNVGAGLNLNGISMKTQHPHSERKIIVIQIFTFEHWYFFRIRVSTLKNTLRPNNEQNHKFRIFRFFCTRS